MSSVFPYEVTCGLLVFVYCQKLKDDDGWNSESISKESQRKILIGILKIIKRSDCTWQAFMEIIKETCTPDLYDLFIKEADSVDTLDEFLDIFKYLEELVQDPNTSMKISAQYIPVHRSSILGLFIRKLILKFKKLSFEEAYLLYANFLKYKAESRLVDSEAESKLDIDNVSSADMSLSQSMDLSCIDESEMNVTPGDNKNLLNKENTQPSSTKPDEIAEIPEGDDLESLQSRKNVCQFIENHVSMLESHRHDVLDPHKLQKRLNLILKLHPNVPDVYYLSFLNYLRICEMNKASKMLCLYFDHKNFESPGSDSSEQEKHQNMFKRFRYGALNLGIMHCKHRNYGQAMTVLKEAVRIAQETNDDTCLKHAIFWIDVVKEETNQLDNGEIEARSFELIKKIYTEDENVIDNVDETESFGMLRCARLLALRGLQQPNTILSNISRIVVSNSRVSDTAILTRSSVMELYGLKLLSMFNCQYPLQTFSDSVGNSMLLAESGRQISEDNITTALCHLASHFASQFQHEQASAVLDFMENRHKCYSQHLTLVHQFRSQINFEKHVYQRDIQEARHIAEFHSVFDKKENTFMLSLVDAISGNHTKAFKRASNLLHQLDTHHVDSSQLVIKIRLLLIELKFCSGDSTSNINDILELYNLVKQLHMNKFLVDVQLALVRYHLLFGLHQKALRLIDSIFVTTFSMGNPYQQGNLYYFRAKCEYLELDTMAVTDITDDQNDGYESILQLYDKAFVCYEKADAKARMRDVFYEKAFVYHRMGLVQDRNSTSTQYRLLNEQLKGTISCCKFLLY